MPDAGGAGPPGVVSAALQAPAYSGSAAPPPPSSPASTSAISTTTTNVSSPASSRDGAACPLSSAPSPAASSSSQQHHHHAQDQQSLQQGPAEGQQQHQQQPPEGPAAKKPPKKWEPLALPNPMQIQQQDLMNHCLIKGVISGAMGGLAGGAFGLFTASIENSGGPTEMLPLETKQKPTRVVLREMLVNMRDKSVSYAKGFAYFGALYSFNECVIEKYRAKHDRHNAMLAGCATGAMMAYGAGPKAMCFGCVSVGAFSAAIEHFLDL